VSRYSMKSINNASLAFSKCVRIDFLIGINGQGLKHLFQFTSLALELIYEIVGFFSL
jgi:hypothetical protein